MREVNDELKSIRNSAPEDPPTLKDLEDMAEHASTAEYISSSRRDHILNRMLPECYTTFTFDNMNIQNLHEETLFYIFYAAAQSEIQIKAYNELVNKGYYFSKQLESFVMLSDPKIADRKKHNVLVFDPCEWSKATREIVFDEAFIGSLEGQVSDD